MDSTISDQSQGSSGQDSGAWLSARLGNAIDIWVDRQINQPLYVSDPSQAYGVDEYGRIYQRGQASASVNLQTGRISPMTLLLIVGAFYLLTKKG